MVVEVLLYLLILLLASILIFFLVVRNLICPTPEIARSDAEKYFVDPTDSSRHRFPDMLSTMPEEDVPSVYLSVIIPAYNEETRLPKMLNETIDYLEKRRNDKTLPSVGKIPAGEEFSYEIIIVDDGSKDRTSQVGLDYAYLHGGDRIRVLTLDQNRGKGGAVRLGMLSSRGKLLLLADADGATLFKDVEKLEAYLHNMCEDEEELLHGIAIGSRKHLEEESKAKRSVFRTILMIGFHFLVWFFAVRSIRDTQCGFKLFGRKIARVLFTSMHVEKWAFDVEILYIAETLKCKLGEIPVTWTEIEGSKIIPVFSWLQMAKDLMFISFMYTVSAWSLPQYKIKRK